MGYGMDSSFGSWHELGRAVLLPTASRSFLEPIQPPTQRLMWALSLEIKQLKRETDHSRSSIMVELYLHSSIRIHDVVLN
jgi:hypothetical protein